MNQSVNRFQYFLLIWLAQFVSLVLECRICHRPLLLYYCPLKDPLPYNYMGPSPSFTNLFLCLNRESFVLYRFPSDLSFPSLSVLISCNSRNCPRFPSFNEICSSLSSGRETLHSTGAPYYSKGLSILPSLSLAYP